MVILPAPENFRRTHPGHTMSQDPRTAPIGVFDSGVGGLTVMRSVVDALPQEHLVYLGDTARVPYGNRAAETVRRYAINATRLLIERGVKALVVACNTATAHAMPTLREHFDLPVIGVVDPVARRAIEATEVQALGVLGTRGTVRSDSYPRAIRRLGSEATVHQVPSPLLVPLAEEGWTKGSVVQEVARHYLTELVGTGVDTLILGCTHYPILRETLQTVAVDLLGEHITLLDSGEATAARLQDVLARGGLARPDAGQAPHEFLLTDLSPAFVDTAERFFGDRPERLVHVDITDSTP